MAEVLPPPTPVSPSSPRPASPSASTPSSTSLLQPRSQPEEPNPNYAEKRLSTHSHTSATSPSRTQSTGIEYPAFASSLPYTLVRDFAYPVFHPMHYGAPLESSRSSTPTHPDWNPGRRQSDPMDQWHNTETLHHGGWSAGIWGGDGGMPGERDLDYYDDEEEGHIAALPSTSFSSTADANILPLEFAEHEVEFKKGKHRKSKSYGSIGEFERGRRRDSSRKSRGGGGASAETWTYDQRSSLGRSSAAADSNGEPRRDSRNNTLPSRSYHHSTSSTHSNSSEPIPLDSEPATHASPQRHSMSPEDEELFAGPSLALYAFEPENSNELRLEEGQEIMVSYRHGQGWLVASDPVSGEQGLVPEAYVRLIADMPNYDRERGEWIDVEEFEEGESTGEVLDGETEDVSYQGTGERMDPLTAQKMHETAFGEESEGGDIEASTTRASEAVT